MDHWIFFSARVEEEGPLFGRPVFLHGGSLERLNGFALAVRIDRTTMCEKAVCGRERQSWGRKAWRHDKFGVCGVLVFSILTFFISLSV